MAIPLLMLAAAAALAWLSVFDRMSVLALALVELETKVGFAVWPVFAAAGLALLLFRLLGRRPRRASPPRPLTRDAARIRPQGPPNVAPAEGAPADSPPLAPGAPWLETLRAGARGVSDDPMGRVRFHDAAGVPLALVLTAVTREQARRRVAAYAAWLATIPVPPTARVRVVSSPDIGAGLNGLFRGELARHFPADAFHVAGTHEGADATFSYPDPRWSS